MKYNLSYTAASLRIHDTLLVAQALLEGSDYAVVDEQIGNGKSSTGIRIRREMVKRLQTLTPAQLNHLTDATLSDAYKIAFLAICKTYDFIHQFVVEVLREKVIQFDYQVTDGDYLSYYSRKAELHPQLDTITENSQYKVKQVLFKILEEAGFIDSVRNKQLQPQFLSADIEQLIRDEDPQLLRIFFYTDSDVAQSPFTPLEQ